MTRFYKHFVFLHYLQKNFFELKLQFHQNDLPHLYRKKNIVTLLLRSQRYVENELQQRDSLSVETCDVDMVFCNCTLKLTCWMLLHAHSRCFAFIICRVLIEYHTKLTLTNQHVSLLWPVPWRVVTATEYRFFQRQWDAISHTATERWT